ncbi:MAG: hypothetical protein JRH20_02230 [Deltaproteobacteria bacterium]|nr:hypothetical protein [Deltaproteobacteria bacterium]
MLTLPALIGLGACGGGSLSHTISNSKLKDMSRQGQLWIYDAENGIVVALDRLDEARDELYRIKTQLKLADRRISAAKKRRNGLGVNVSEAWEDSLEYLEDWARARIRLERFGVNVAKASIELAKAQVIQREDLLGDKDFTLKEFKDQLRKLQDSYDRRRKTVRKLRRKARKKEARWRKMRRRYVAQTGDHDSGLWID